MCARLHQIMHVLLRCRFSVPMQVFCAVPSSLYFNLWMWFVWVQRDHWEHQAAHRHHWRTAEKWKLGRADSSHPLAEPHPTSWVPPSFLPSWSSNLSQGFRLFFNFIASFPPIFIHNLPQNEQDRSFISVVHSMRVDLLLSICLRQTGRACAIHVLSAELLPRYT